MIVRYDDHEEVIEAGDAFYMPRGMRLMQRKAHRSCSSARLRNWRRSSPQ
jgi:hypothetical protein